MIAGEKVFVIKDNIATLETVQRVYATEVRIRGKRCTNYSKVIIRLSYEAGQIDVCILDYKECGRDAFKIVQERTGVSANVIRETTMVTVPYEPYYVAREEVLKKRSNE